MSQGTLKKRDQKDFQSHKILKYSVRFCALEMTGKIHPLKITLSLPKQDQNKDNTSEHANRENVSILEVVFTFDEIFH